MMTWPNSDEQPPPGGRCRGVGGFAEHGTMREFRNGLVRGADPAREVMVRRRYAGKRQNEVLQAWNPADQPDWLANEIGLLPFGPGPPPGAVLSENAVYRS